MKHVITGILISTIMLHGSLSLAAVTVTPMQDDASLVNALVGPGIQIVAGSSAYRGDTTTAGTFNNGTTPLGIESGVILRTGSPESGNIPRASILEFDFRSDTQELYCEYVFATEEYDESGMPNYPDILKLYVDGKHVALLPDGVTPVSLKKLVEQDSPAVYDNRDGRFKETAYSGFTSVLTATAVALDPNASSHHFKLLVMNEGDPQKHSAIFLEAGSCRATRDFTPDPDDPDDPASPAAVPEPGTLILVGLGLLTGLALKRRYR